MCHGWFRQEAGAGRLRSDHFPENEEQKTDNGGGAKNCGSHVRVSGAVYRFLPGSESENQRVQDVWKRLCQKPGLTGVWQVSGRSTITDFEEIVQMDVDYIDHWSIWRDIGILFKTVWLVVCGDDGAQ